MLCLLAQVLQRYRYCVLFTYVGTYIIHSLQLPLIHQQCNMLQGLKNWCNDVKYKLKTIECFTVCLGSCYLAKTTGTFGRQLTNSTSTDKATLLSGPCSKSYIQLHSKLVECAVTITLLVQHYDYMHVFFPNRKEILVLHHSSCGVSNIYVQATQKTDSVIS